MIPLMRPNPPRLSQAASLLTAIEDSGTFSNFGPVNTRFETEIRDRLFGGTGACLTVCNATIGLMLAISEATIAKTRRQRYALMPSFTFAATAQAALWCGLTPLLCDIDPLTWAPSAESEAKLLDRYQDQIAIMLPYATFGYDIDLARYQALGAASGVPVVVDAAASLGTRSAGGQGFGAGFAGSLVYSMHATKSFAVGEGGLIHSADPERIARLRAMANFGFGQPRQATMLGMNAKLGEVSALTALLRLQDYDDVVRHRDVLMQRYRSRMPWMRFQPDTPQIQAHQFVPAMLPRAVAPRRALLQARMRDAGIGVATYFDPHLAEQPYIAAKSRCGDLRVTQDVAKRMVSLPLYDSMTLDDVDEVAECLWDAMAPRARAPTLGDIAALRI
jgi:dTDP-4-amino-4,6-dideoxygalactose transaminase